MNYCGIDFGTTNTAMIYFSEHAGKSFIGDEYANSDKPLPSIVAINKKTGEVKVGNDVKNNIKTYTENHEIVLSVKTILDDPKKIWEAGNKKWSPTQIAAEIFKAIKNNASNRNIKISDVVISVPVNFSSSKKICLKKAAQLADINITKFVSEPTAAFIAHYEELKSFSNIVVFDWGGGTLDISALVVKNDTIQEIATDNMYKAGDNIDRELARLTYEKVIKSSGLNLIPFDELPVNEYDELISKAELAKIKLSNTNIDSYSDICGIQGKPRNITTTYEDLCSVADSIVNEAISKLQNIITDNYKRQVDRILCVGGSSNIRLLREKLRSLYGNILLFPDNPQWDIADGACTIAASPKNNVYKLAYDISIILSDNKELPLLQQGQLIPCKKSHVHLSTTDSSTTANFIIKLGNTCKEVIVPVLGGIDETFDVYAYVDEYSILYIDMKNNKTKEEYNIFHYEKLDLCYNI